MNKGTSYYDEQIKKQLGFILDLTNKLENEKEKLVKLRKDKFYQIANKKEKVVKIIVCEAPNRARRASMCSDPYMYCLKATLPKCIEDAKKIEYGKFRRLKVDGKVSNNYQLSGYLNSLNMPEELDVFRAKSKSSLEKRKPDHDLVVYKYM